MKETLEMKKGFGWLLWAILTLVQFLEALISIPFACLLFVHAKEVYQDDVLVRLSERIARQAPTDKLITTVWGREAVHHAVDAQQAGHVTESFRTAILRRAPLAFLIQQFLLVGQNRA